MIRLMPWLIGLLLLASVGGLAVAAASRIPPGDPEPASRIAGPEVGSMTVMTVHPTLTEWPDLIETSGVIEPWQEAVINAQVGGYQIIELRADVGDVVEKGQVVALLNPAMLHAQRAELQARLDRAVADRKRAALLSAKGNMSEKNLLQAETEEKSARALLEQKGLEIKYATVVAPDSGIVMSRSATLGQVSALGTELFRLIRQGRLEWRGEIPASELWKVAPGQSAEVMLPGGEIALGTVRQVAPSLDESSRRGVAYVDLGMDSAARAGMYTKGRIVLARRQALVVPAAGLLIRDGRHYVAKATVDGTGAAVTLAPVAIGGYSGALAEIMGGLSPLDTIVSEGAGLLNDGDRVRIVGGVSP